MEHSSGIILYKKISDKTLFFVCTPDGPMWEGRELWSFPKGHIENGESIFEAAIREFEEETNIAITHDNEKYLYLGDVRQNKHKIVSVFCKEYEDEDMSDLRSNIIEYEYHGEVVRHGEIREYAWKTIEELSENGMKCYLPIYKKIEENV